MTTDPCCDVEAKHHRDLPCPACGRPGKRVPEETPGALVRPEAAGQVVAGMRYRFCATPGCPVAYYPDAAGAAPPIAVGALRVPVGQKGMGDPRPLCSCFGFTEADVRARAAAAGEPVSAVVKRRMRGPGCACATKNPSGHCCLGDIRAAERRRRTPGGRGPRSVLRAAGGPDAPTPPVAVTTGGGAGRGELAALLAMVPGIGAALLPAVACPACWPAYAGLLSSFGVGFVNYTPFLLPIMALFLAVALATLSVQGRRRGHYGPLLLGVAGTAGLLVGRFAVASDPLIYAGIGLLIAASTWNAWPRRGAACAVEAGGAGCGCGK